MSENPNVYPNQELIDGRMPLYPKRVQDIDARMQEINNESHVPNTQPEETTPQQTAETKSALTPEEIENHKIYAAALDYDMTNPEDLKYTPEEEKNLVVLEFLKSSFKNAFINGTTDKFGDYIMSKDIYDFETDEHKAPKRHGLIISKAGVTFVSGGGYHKDDKLDTHFNGLDVSEILDTPNLRPYNPDDESTHGHDIKIHNSDGSNFILDSIKHVNFDEVPKEDISLMKQFFEASNKDAKNIESQKPSAADVTSLFN